MSAQDAMSAGELLDEFYSAYNSGDAARAAALYGSHGAHVEIAQGAERRGPDIEEGLRRFIDSFPDARWEPRSRCLSGERAAVAYTLTGTLSGSRLGPFEPRGQKLSLRGVHMFELASGRIQRSEDYWDAASFGRQMRNPAG